MPLDNSTQHQWNPGVRKVEWLAAWDVLWGRHETRVRTLPWKIVSAADKWAWFYLWHKSKLGTEEIYVTATEIAQFTNNDTKAGRDRLENLEKAGLIEVRSKINGVYTIWVHDPFQQASVKTVEWDGQLELPLPGITLPMSTGEEVGEDPPPLPPPHDMNTRTSNIHVHHEPAEDPPPLPPPLRRPEQIQRPWDFKSGVAVTDDELKAAVHTRAGAVLRRLYNEAVKLEWIQDCDDSKLRFLTICHHAATARVNSPMRVLSKRVSQGLDVSRIPFCSEDWAASLIRDSQNPR